VRSSEADSRWLAIDSWQLAFGDWLLAMSLVQPFYEGKTFAALSPLAVRYYSD
jgi:hypothetical protein